MNNLPPLQNMNPRPRPVPFNAQLGRNVLPQNEFVEENGDYDFEDDYIDDEDDDVPVIINVRKVSDTRNDEFILRLETTFRELVLKAGICVELQGNRFMRIIHVASNELGKIILIGDELAYAKEDSPVIDAFQNELVWHIRKGLHAIDLRNNNDYSIISSSGHPVSCEGLHIRPVEDVIRERTIVFTNWPMQNFRPSDYPRGLSTDFDGSHEHFDRLFCRWKSTELDRVKAPKQGVIEKLTPEEADMGFQNTNTQLRVMWRGFTMLYGSEHGTYSVGDAFSGGGGISTGARLEGLRVLWAFDNNKNAIEVYNLNADTKTTVLLKDVSDFLHEARRAGSELRKVDILHLSPPCQPFSPANTTPNLKNNEMNQAVLLSCGDLIECTRPRIVTIEQTAGLVVRYTDWFYRLLSLLVHNGYSVRWKIVKFEQYGVPQRRHRLIMIAAGPGEVLLSFPEPTTSPDGLIRPRTATIAETLQYSPEATHKGDNWYATFRVPKPPYDANTQAFTITTSGGKNYHPSGIRGFSVRELALLQTFDEYFLLPHSVGRIGSLRKVIGNAVPPKFARILFSHIVQHLRQCDRREIRDNATRGIYEVIEIDD